MLRGCAPSASCASSLPSASRSEAPNSQYLETHLQSYGPLQLRRLVDISHFRLGFVRFSSLPVRLQIHPPSLRCLPPFTPAHFLRAPAPG